MDNQIPQCFLSYSRDDPEQKKRLVAALQAAGCSVAGDWNIPAGPDWWQQVCDLITHADVFVLLATRNATRSNTVRNEVKKAADSGKRIVTVIGWGGVEDEDVPEPASRPNWLDLPPENTNIHVSTTFAESLAGAIFTDFDELAAHTQLLIAAKAWTGDGRRSSRLLRGAVLTRADALIHRLTNKTGRWHPIPTDEQREFVRCSRRARFARGVSAVATVVLLGGAAFAGYAEYRRRSDSANLESYSRQLAARSPTLLATRPDQALLMAVEAAKNLPGAPEAEAAVRQALAVLLRPTVELCARHGSSPVVNRSRPFNPRRILAISCEDGVRIYDLASKKLLRTFADVTTPHGMAVTEDGRRVVMRLPGTVRTYEIDTGVAASDPKFDRVLPELGRRSAWPLQDPVTEALSPNGRYAATFRGPELFLHDTEKQATKKIHLPFAPHRVTFSADDEFVVVSSPHVDGRASGRFSDGGALLIHVTSRRQTPVIGEPVEEISVGSDTQGRILVLVGHKAGQGAGGTESRRFSLFIGAEGHRFDRQHTVTVRGDSEFPTSVVTTHDGRALVWNRFQVTSILPVAWTDYSSSDSATFQDVAVGSNLTGVVNDGTCVGAQSTGGNCRGTTIRIIDQNGQARAWSYLTSDHAGVAIGSETEFVVGTDDSAWIGEYRDEYKIETVSHRGLVKQALVGSSWWASRDSLDNVRIAKANRSIALQGTAVAVADATLAVAEVAPDSERAMIQFFDLVDLQSSKRLRPVVASKPGRVLALALSADGRVAISVENPRDRQTSDFSIVDSHSGFIACSMSESVVNSLLWSPRGDWLSVVGPMKWLLRDTYARGCRPLSGPQPFINRAVAGFSADGAEVVLSGPSNNGGPSLLAHLDRMADFGDYRAELNPGNLKIEDVDKATFSDTRTRLAVSTRAGHLHIIDSKSRAVMQSIAGNDLIHAMRFISDGSAIEVLRGAAQLEHVRYAILPRDVLLTEACARSARKTLEPDEWLEVAGGAPSTRHALQLITSRRRPSSDTDLTVAGDRIADLPESHCD
jgi:hypothetical protein